MPIPVFYSERQQVNEKQPGSPSPGKPAKVLASWKLLGLPLDLRDPVPATTAEFALAHDPEYVAEVLSCERSNGFGTQSQAVADSDATSIIGGGEETTISFDPSMLEPGGDYTYFCSFPAHFALMFGKLVVN